MKLDALSIVAILWVLSRMGGRASPPSPPGPKPLPPQGVSPWSDDEMRAFIDTVNPIVGATVFALNVYQVESGNNPRAINPKGGAAGLAQVMPQYLPHYGWTAGGPAFANSGVRGQLPVIAQLLLDQVKQIGGRPQKVATLYHANFFPKTLGKAYVVRRKDKGGDYEEDTAYQWNKALDANRDGVIDEGDLDAVLTKARASSTYRALAAQMERLADEPPVVAVAALPAKGKPVKLKPMQAKG